MKKILLFMAIGILLASAVSADKFKCTDDCEQPKPGYVLIGCTTVKNHAVTHDQGRHIPAKQPWNGIGYVYIASSTEYDAQGNVVSDEIIACDYWPVNQTLPPTPEELYPELFNETEAEDMEDNLDRYNDNVEYFPGFVKSIFGNQNMRVFFTKKDGQEREYAAFTEKSVIVESSNWVDNDGNGNDDGWDEAEEKLTMNVWVEEESIDMIEESEAPMATFMEVWGDGIRYEGVTLGAKIRSGLLKIGMWFVDLFI